MDYDGKQTNPPGRRGLDATGTVIILCKGVLPDYNDLIHMVQGKVPEENCSSWKELQLISESFFFAS